MGDALCVVPQASQLLRLPRGPQLALEQRLLRLFLENPLLDEDAEALALRAGVPAEQATAALAALCAEGILQPAGGNRGFLLAAAGLAVTLQAQTPAAPGAAGSPAGQSAGDAGRLVQAQAAAALAAIRRFLEDPRASNLAAAQAALADIERLLAAG